MGFFTKIKKIWKKDELLEQDVEKTIHQPEDSPQPTEPPKPEPAHEKIKPESVSEPGPEPEVIKKQEPQKEDSKSWFKFWDKKEEELTKGYVPSERNKLETPQEKPGQAAQADLSGWQADLSKALEEAEPRLGIWMEHILTGIEKKGPILWERLHFLFQQIEVPKQEAQKFIKSFDSWLDNMDYEYVQEFRSELQYRMALALELEDEEDERDRLFLKLSEGLGKTKAQLSQKIDQLLSLNSSFDEEFWEELEEILIMADVGYSAAQKLQQRLRARVKESQVEDAQGFKDLLREELAALMPKSKEGQPPASPEVVLMIGVNGVGKTTTIAKLAHRAQMQGRKVMLVAGDTFRAAAIEQLNIWANRVGAGFYAKEHGSDAAAVAFEALDKAQKEGYDLVFIDTAGRLHTKVGLMEELNKVFRVIKKKIPGAPHRAILVLDATTGQNALSQTELFSKAAQIDEIVLTKLDGTAKGGVVVGIALEHNIPISFIGLGEKMEDLRPFSGEDFAKALLE